MDAMIALASDPGAWAALLALVTMEVVLGIDNLIFIAILTTRLPESQQPRARRLGIGLALVFRLALLGSIVAVTKLTAPVVTIYGHSFSWRDIILIAGGLFLVWKATKEVHHRVDPEPDPAAHVGARPSFALTIAQIVALDLVFSIDSILTAIGMSDHLPIMVIAVVVAVLAMLLAAEPLAAFIRRHSTIVMLALAFLLMIGMALIAEGFGSSIQKGYIYAAMAFAAFVESLNMLERRARK